MSIPRTCLLLLVMAASLARAQQPDSGQPLPTPVWVQTFDQGEVDAKLKGFRTPRGVKLEIVAGQPTVVNPRQFAFADDGTLYFLQWRPGEFRVESSESKL